MIKVLREKPVEEESKYYSLEDLLKEDFVVFIDRNDGDDKMICLHKKFKTNEGGWINDHAINIITTEGIAANYMLGRQEDFRVFKTKREMFLWLAED